MSTLWLLLFFFSGAAGLGYQTVWTKMFANGLGHEVPAMLSVISAFMAGMALGAWKIRPELRNPAKVYAVLEVVIGLWGVASSWLIPGLNAVTPQILGPAPAPALHWAYAFAVVFLALLPGTAAMGATFAVMERLLARQRAIGALYAANTAGAVAGVLIGTFVLMPQFGLRATAISLGLVNLLCAALALRMPVGVPVSAPPPAAGTTRLRTTVIVTGMLAIGLEVAGVRVLAQFMENTVFTFAAVLAIYLFGTAIGAAVYQRFAPGLWWLLWSASVACLIAVVVLGQAEAIYKQLRLALPDNLGGGVAAELLCASMVFLLPTIVFGAVFSHLFQTAKHAGFHLGRMYALNCAGSALAPLLFAVALLPLAGAKLALIAVGGAYLVLMPHFRVAALAPLVLVFFLPDDLRFAEGNVIADRDGRLASVAVIEDALKERSLRVNNRFQMGGTSAHQAEYRQGHLPLLLHPQPRRALFLGVGTGITLNAAKLYPGLEVEGVELIPEVVEVMPFFRPFNDAVQPSEIVVADARRFVRATPKSYDVIVGDLFHPARDGAGTLYTREHFATIRDRLTTNGLFCQWLPLHQLDEAMLRLIIRTFLDVFPDTHAYLLHFNVEVPVLGLIGFSSPPQFSEHWLESRPVPSEAKALTLADSLRFFGHFVGGPQFLSEYAGEGPINTDDRQVLTFGAPAFSFRRNMSSHGRLWPLLQRDASELGIFGGRLTRYTHARNAYLRGLAEEDQSRAIDAFLESARLSEDFTAGYAQCLSIASLWVREKPEEAKQLLARLIDAQPSRPIAREMLERIK